MTDLKNSKLMWLKAGLFLLIGIGSMTKLICLCPGWRTVILVLLMVWAFCRLYYFMFYVIQHYVDPSYRFSGLISFVAYVMRKKP
jgi:hypothetical protein